MENLSSSITPKRGIFLLLTLLIHKLPIHSINIHLAIIILSLTLIPTPMIKIRRRMTSKLHNLKREKDNLLNLTQMI